MSGVSSIQGLVSTIIPVHNRARLLCEAVESVLAQTYRPIEIIIINDGSTDDTRRVADELLAQHPGEIRVLHQDNAGPGLARDAGRQSARGEFVQYLDSDDILYATKFALQVKALQLHVDCGVAYGMTRFSEYGAQSDPRPWKRTGERIECMFPAFLESRWWGTSTPLYRRDLIDSVGPWLALSNEEDWEYDCRLAARGVRLCFVEEYVSEERAHAGPRLSRGGSVSPSKLRDRAKAHALIFAHAQKAGIGIEAPEMRRFARELFLLARQCGAAGLNEESRELFELAMKASSDKRAAGLDFRLYHIAASIFGWSLVGRIACSVDRLRI